MSTHSELHRQMKEHLAKLPDIEATTRQFLALDPLDPSNFISLGKYVDLEAMKAAYAKKHAWDDEWVRLRVLWMEDTTKP